MIIDGTNLLIGRLASLAAKKALLGEAIGIVNCEKVVISGNKKAILTKYKRLRQMGEPFHGPFIPRIPHLMLKRTIRGMLPYKQEKGKKALKKIKCYLGIPKEFKGKEMSTIPEADASKLPNLKRITLGEISRLLGGIKNE